MIRLEKQRLLKLLIIRAQSVRQAEFRARQ